MKNSPLEANLWLGIELAAWLRLLARNRFAIRPGRWPMAALVTAVAASNSALRGVQSLVYGRRVARVAVPDDPIFIVGHWRTGTTMLHELLALDPRMRAPTTYECLSPNHFLFTERWIRRFAKFLLPRTRPFDNMRMSFDRPQEDEAALALRGAPSPFLSVAFPGRPNPHPRYVDLDELSPRELADWQARFRQFLQLVLYRRPGRLVLKSPQHTNRVRLLAEMFPKARFIYLTRDPYVVFPSTVHFWRTMHERYGLQRGPSPFPQTTEPTGAIPHSSQLREQVFRDFAHMHQRWEQARAHLAAERVYELRYENLAADPLAEVERLYAALDLGPFAAAADAVAQYAQRSRRYKTNEYAELDSATREEIARRWAPYFQRNGYE